jgi:tetratricopeptide (TPR) repeat protein
MPLSVLQLTTLCTPFAGMPAVEFSAIGYDQEGLQARMPVYSPGQHLCVASAWSLVMEACGRVVRTILSAGIAFLLAMLGTAVPLFSYQSSPSTLPPVAISPDAETDCRAKQATPRHFIEAGNFARAAELLLDVYARCPSYENGRDLADAEINAGQFAAAKALVSALLEQQDRAELHSLLGKAEAGEKNDKAAAIEYQKAATLDPSETNVFDFGMSLFHLDHNAAITILRYGVEKYPQSIKLHVGLGVVLYAEGKSLEGAQHLCEAEDLNPSDPHPMEILADTEIVPPTLADKVLPRFASLHKRYPNDGLILFDYAMVQSGRWSGSKGALPPHFAESLKEAIRLNPKMPQAYYQLGLVYGQEEKYADEIRVLKKAISMDPGKEEYYYRIAFAYRKTGDEEQFRQALDEFQRLHHQATDGK